jgi:AcrR family transcriptional regulator
VVESGPGRRERLRHRTREDILDAAMDVVTAQGVAALNLSEVARRVGMGQPSLYRYFPSRVAVYDALFERGMAAHLAAVEAAAAGRAGLASLRAQAVASVRFIVGNPALAMLLFFPAVPGFEPSEAAYRPSLGVQQLMVDALREAVERGELHPDAASERAGALYVALGAGTAALQVGNDQHAGYDEGRFAALVEPALDMFAAYYAPIPGHPASR